MISKELMKEVVPKYNGKYELEEPSYPHYSYIRYGNVISEVINIHELAHKCKEWIVQKGYTLVEAPLMLRITRLCTEENKIWEYSLEEQEAGEYFKPEYTFKAAQWILDNQ